MRHSISTERRFRAPVISRRGWPVLFVAAALFGSAGLLAQKAADKNRVLLETKQVRVREVLIEPGVAYPAHTHQYPHVGVIVRGGTLEFTEQGKVEKVDFKDGAAGWREANVTHSVRNPGKSTVHVVEVELK